MAASFLILPIVLLASLALAAASCWGIYALTKQRWVWLLSPVFLVFWLAVGVVPLSLIAWSVTATPAPPPIVTYELVEEVEDEVPPSEPHDPAEPVGESP